MSLSDLVLDLSHVSVTYEKTEVLSDLSLSIREGEVHALLGPNGAGKTTLIRTILGRIRPSRGQVFVAPSGVGFVPQEIALFPALTIRENLVAFGKLAGLSRYDVKRRVEAVTNALGFRDRSNQSVSDLSGGWQRRVNVAVAILNNPALLILDEPTVGVDKAAREGLQDVLRQLAADGTAILMTTHDFAEAEAVCSHAVLLKNGRCLAQGAIPQLMHHAFDGQYVVSVETQEAASAHDRKRLAQLGLHECADNRVEAILPHDRALEVVSKMSNSLGSLRRAGFEQPSLQTLYHHHIKDLTCP